MANQWIVSFTTISPTRPTPPSQIDLEDMVAGLFTQPSATWLAGPQSVDDGAGPTTDWEWMITFRTYSTTAPTNTALKDALVGLFGSTVDNVWLAGPQSVDDGDITEQKSRG